MGGGIIGNSNSIPILGHANWVQFYFYLRESLSICILAHSQKWIRKTRFWGSYCTFHWYSHFYLYISKPKEYTIIFISIIRIDNNSCGEWGSYWTIGLLSKQWQIETCWIWCIQGTIWESSWYFHLDSHFCWQNWGEEIPLATHERIVKPCSMAMDYTIRSWA